LIVEDNADAAQTLALLLGIAGYEVQAAGDGPSAARAVQEQPPEVILMDLTLPGEDGYTVAKRLRGFLHRKPLLVAMTGLGEEGDRQRSLEEGFDDHIVKPVDPPRLLDMLRAYAAARDSRESGNDPGTGVAQENPNR
jgi:CheY-like chemotaxis protein